MALADKQREALIAEHGEPRATVNFDVFHDGELAMWTNFNHGDNFGDVKVILGQMRDHLDEFIRDGGMCPFRNINKNTDAVKKRELEIAAELDEIWGTNNTDHNIQILIRKLRGERS